MTKTLGGLLQRSEEIAAERESEIKRVKDQIAQNEAAAAAAEADKKKKAGKSKGKKDKGKSRDTSFDEEGPSTAKKPDSPKEPDMNVPE